MTLRRETWIVLTTAALLTACTDRPSVGGETEGESEDGSGSTTSVDPTNPNPTNPNPTTVGTGDDTTGNPTTGTPTSGPDDTTGSPGGDGCCEVHDTPGCNEPDVVDCVCALEATCCAFAWDQNCVDLAEGKECMATCEDPGDTDDPGTTGPMGNECDDVVTFEMMPSEATYMGAWQLGISMIGEGEISVLPNPGMGTDGSFMYEPDIPCADTWYIWTRYWEDGADDSYLATIDGMPMPEAIFEGDCTGGGSGYNWAPLNWRAQGDPPCTYTEDPWAPNWDAGVHQIEFSYRESLAMGRILITNDQDLVPPP